ncbi:MAG TPA: OsmC family protein [Acidimicrobiia bacterium]|nr:OsmC family protein [Acidimicrobiia bacterium]
MPERTAQAHWEGPVKEGRGTIAVESGAFSADYSFGARFESEAGTNPEELLGAAHAGCFTMALALGLTEAGHPPARIDTTARVAIEKGPSGFHIPHIELRTEAEVPGIDAGAFNELAEGAKANCPVSKALAATEISLEAKLLG